MDLTPVHVARRNALGQAAIHELEMMFLPKYHLKRISWLFLPAICALAFASGCSQAVRFTAEPVTETARDLTQTISTSAEQPIKATESQFITTPGPPTVVGTSQPATRLYDPTSTEQPRPSSEVKLDNPEIDGRIYAWIDNGYYFSVKSPFLGQGLEPGLPNVADPDQAILLTFAKYTDQIAYLTITNNTELWVADLNLTTIERIWIDETNWFGEPGNRDYLQISWGPRDHSVILTDLIQTPRTIVYHFPSRTTTQISGACDGIGLPPVFPQLTIVCSDRESSSRLYLSGDGSQEISSSGTVPPTTSVQNWAFSPDGNRILYANSQNELVISGVGDKQMTLPLTYDPPTCCGVELMREELQWSLDGTRLLVYGKESNIKTPRWYVLNANTGEMVWVSSPKNVVNILEDQLSVAFNMALSPDGLWFVTSYYNMSEATRYLAITSLTTGEVVKIGEGTVDQLKWVSNEVCPPWVTNGQEYSQNQWESMPKLRKPSDYIGFQFYTLPPLVLNGAWTIDDGDYSMTWLSDGSVDLIWFEKQIYACIEKSYTQVIDVLELPAIDKKNGLFSVMNAECYINGAIDPELVVIAEVGDSGQLANIGMAWRANRETGRFEELPAAGIICTAVISE